MSVHRLGRGFGHVCRIETGAAIVGSAPSNSVVPFFQDGNGNTVTTPVVGQTVFINPGTWSNSPLSYSFSITGNSGVNSGSWNAGDPLIGVLVWDADAGRTFTVSVTATNTFGQNTATSAATSAVAAINLANAITAFSRTSASGTVPMTWSLSFGSNVYEGYTLWARVYSDSGLSTLVQDVKHVLTHADLQSGATIDMSGDGYTNPTATQWLQLAVFTTSPNGTGYSYTYGTAISPTDAVVAMTWSTTDNVGVTLSNGNLTATLASSPSGVRASRGIGSGKKVYWEITGNFEDFGAADSTASFSTVWGGAGGDGSGTIHACDYQPGNGFIFFNGTGTAAAGYTAATTWGLALDTTASPYTLAFYKANVLQATISLSGIGATLFPAAQLNNGQSVTLNPGTTPGGTAGFTYTPPTGFVAP